MSNNQMHGKTYENQNKVSGGIFAYATRSIKLSHNERSGIVGSDDQKFGYPTSMKSAVSNAIGL